MEILLQWLISLGRLILPFWILEPDEGGVRTFCGRFPKTLKPGFHPVCPILGRIREIPVKEQVLDIRSQSLTTKDGQSVSVGVSVAYEVLDPYRAICEVQDWDKSLANEALGCVGDYVSAHEYAQLLNADDMSKSVRDSLRATATRDWGLKINRVRRSDFAKSKAIRLMGLEK